MIQVQSASIILAMRICMIIATFIFSASANTLAIDGDQYDNWAVTVDPIDGKLNFSGDISKTTNFGTKDAGHGFFIQQDNFQQSFLYERRLFLLPKCTR